jgi:hypothetical protein
MQKRRTSSVTNARADFKSNTGEVMDLLTSKLRCSQLLSVSSAFSFLECGPDLSGSPFFMKKKSADKSAHSEALPHPEEFTTFYNSFHDLNWSFRELIDRVLVPQETIV